MVHSTLGRILGGRERMNILSIEEPLLGVSFWEPRLMMVSRSIPRMIIVIPRYWEPLLMMLWIWYRARLTLP